MASLLTCKVHPTVLLSIIDAYERRGETKDGVVSKVIGTLLGTFEKGIVEITNCYTVPHSEINDEAQISPMFNKEMYDLYKKSNPSELPVGWFSTHTEVNENCMVYHSYYQQFVSKCLMTRDQLPIVYLTVDTSLSSGRMGLKAYIRMHAGIPKQEREQCTIFMPVDVELMTYESEQIGIDLLMTGKDHPKRQAQLMSGVEQINRVTDQLIEWIGQVKAYVKDVQDGKRQPDSVVGRKLMELISNVTQVQPKQFQNMLVSSMKDYLMVVYLAQLAKTQLSLNEKLISRTN